MSVFGSYSLRYDALYRDKDYKGEARFVQTLLDRFAPGCRSVLELGCGTGAYTVLLAELGYEVHGVDRSADMLRLADARVAQASAPVRARIHLSQGDLRDLQIGKQFDAIVALFHVMSYLSTNEDVQKALACARKHLSPGGLFLFDCWYGPAVLTDRPALRVKDIEDTSQRILRIARPVLRVNDNLVDVHYDLFCWSRGSATIEEAHETHTMRFFFGPEIGLLLNTSGFELKDALEWMTGRDPGSDTWSVVFLARPREID